MKRAIHTVNVYGASSSRISAKYTDAAYELGQLLAKAGIACINGGGSSGIMRAVSDGVLDGGGHVIGVIPQFMKDNGWHYSRLSELAVTADMHSRKSLMAERGDAAVAMPGGCGTLDELFEIITWRQLGLFDGEVIIFNVDHYYDDLLAMLARGLSEGFMRPTHVKLWHVATTAQEVMEIISGGVETVQVESKY